MKKYFIYAASALALASCSSDDFLGENPGNEQNASSAINFGGETGKITRATSNTGTTQQMLDGQFKVYGVKKTSETQFIPVFHNYSIWYEDNKTTSNTNKWEYVGAKNTPHGTANIKFDDDQFIKYWDYAASEYHFVAGSPIKAFNYNTDQDPTTGVKIKSATIFGLAGHININETGTALETNPVYVATPKVVKKADYQKPVQFVFNRQQAMVRVGIYETIPGYSITDIKFYAYDDNGDLKVTDKENIILTSAKDNYFVGGSNLKGTVTYNWTGETPSYTYTYDDTNLEKSKNWYAGKLNTVGKLAEVSTETNVERLYGKDDDMSKTGYFTVLPTPSGTDASPIVIKCDYTLYADDNSTEAIKVTGATAAIPAAYSKWNVNTRYTYLFKISDNTNGYTGDDPDKAGLYPITFDAVVTESTDKTQGTTTIVENPSITTYQEGSVTDNGIKYKSDKEIKVTVTNDKGEVQTLTTGGTAVGNVAVYKLTGKRTEADLQLVSVTQAEFTDASNQGVNLATDKMSFTFTPTEAGFYAIQYLTTAEVAGTTPAAYTYKVVEVK